MLPLAQLIAERCFAGERVALCTLVKARGSTPQETGAKMAVTRDGTLHGTLGGGCVEAEVRRRAVEFLHLGRSELLTFRLDHDYGWDDGLICGGTMLVQVQVLEGAGEAARFQQIAADLQARQAVEFQFEYQTDEGSQTYRELLEPRPTLVIAGGGHVGQSLARIAHELDFDVMIIDDRAEYTSEQRFATAKQRITGDIATELGKIAADHLTYIVIVTRGHNHDGQALEAVVRSAAKYIGLIGSKRKIAKIYGELAARGVTLEQLQRVHAPIGLEINSISVPEIAVSIAAELVAVRRGETADIGKPMKLSDDEVERIIRRSGFPA